MILSLSVSIILGILSLLLFMGRCSWFIAGYNTASKEEKSKYDEKKLCRTIGFVFMCLSISTALMTFNHDKTFIMNCIIFQLLACLFGVVYANIRCKRK